MEGPGAFPVGASSGLAEAVELHAGDFRRRHRGDMLISCSLAVFFVGVLTRGALLVASLSRTPDFWKLPYANQLTVKVTSPRGLGNGLVFAFLSFGHGSGTRTNLPYAWSVSQPLTVHPKSQTQNGKKRRQEPLIRQRSPTQGIEVCLSEVLEASCSEESPPYGKGLQIRWGFC